MLVFTTLCLATAALAANTEGCGKLHHPTSGSTITVDGNRTALLYVPPLYDAISPSPLIVSFHGHYGIAKTFATQTQYNNPSVNDKYIVVFPQGVGPNGTTWQGMYPSSGANDLKFINDLLDRVSLEFCLDSDKIYASGFSNGGGFVNAMACSPEISNRFSAFGMNSAAIWQGSEDLDHKNGCNPNRSKTPVFEIHGSADPVIHYGGSDGAESGKPYMGLQAWLHGWAKRNGCEGAEQQRRGYGLFRYFYKPACSTRHYKVLGLGHTWWQPSGPHIGSTRNFMDFFAKHSGVVGA